MSAAKHTPGPLRLALYGVDADPFEQIRELLSHGSGPVWAVTAPEHPNAVGGWEDRPAHAVTTAITGNGPASKANATLYAAAPELLKALEFCVQAMRSAGFDTIPGGLAAQAAAEARAAIAKARGA